MQYNLGYIKQYFPEKGYGFIQQRLSKGTIVDLWFDISKVKRKYPEIAQLLDAGKTPDQLFWYSIESNKQGPCASEFWLSFEVIPTDIQSSFKKQFLDVVDDYISLIFCNSSPSSEELARMILSESEYEKAFSLDNTNESIPQEIHSKEEIPEKVWISKLGLPEDVFQKIFLVAEQYRTNVLSLIPGGSEVIVEYNTGSVRLYDKIKDPSSYISSFFGGKIESARQEMSRIFCRFPEENSDVDEIEFEEIWNLSMSITPWDALKVFKKNKLAEVTLEEDYLDYDPPNLSADRNQFDTNWEYAEAVYGIPDPRLVED